MSSPHEIHLVGRATPTPVADVLTMPQKIDWNDLLMSTILSVVDDQLTVRMLDC